MGLLALEMQFDQIRQHLLQALREAGWGFELPNIVGRPAYRSGHHGFLVLVLQPVRPVIRR